MKKLIFLIMVMLFLMPGVVFAGPLDIGDIISKLEVKQGVAFSLADSQLNYLSTAELMDYKGFSLEAGSAYDAEKTGIKAVGVISYDLLKLKDLGVNVPILDMIHLRPGIYFGMGRIGGNNETDYGLSLSMISFSW